ncbi:hypothetical protein ACHAXT_005237 [Thalassiosira profunda]
MAAATTLEDAIGETRDVLQPLFAKPKLSAKLLTKPPFRFIHDVVVATLRATGFPNGFFSLEELDSYNFKDSKSAKVEFLTKLISLVSVGNGSALDVSPSKIVAGLEPLKTNLLLSALGRLAQDEELARDDLVQHCLAGNGIEEFQSRNAALPAVHDGETPEAEALLTQHNGLATMVQACNEDIEKTKSVISAIVAKPKCTDKLLSKPPFRFIHDLITAIGAQTEFDLRQIFSEEELVSSNVKEKHAKLQFLEKLVSALESTLEISLDVKPAKIVSGLEPERTRYLLQVFVVVATTKCLVTAEGEEAKENSPVKALDEVEEVSLSMTTNSKELSDLERSPHTKEHVPVEAPVDSPASSDSSVTSNGEEQTALASKDTFVPPATSRGDSLDVASLLDQGPASSGGATRPATALGKTRAPVRRASRPATAVAKGRDEARLEEAGARNVQALPAKLSDVDFVSLAEAIEGIASAVAPIGAFVSGLRDEMDSLVSQKGARGSEEKLKILDSQTKSQVAEIKRLEAKVKRNDITLKKLGVTHAY